MDVTDTPDGVDGDEEPPDFEAWDAPAEVVEGDTIRERMLDAVVQLRSPSKVSTIADVAGCDTETAREYLEWFAEMGVVRKVSRQPARYERNESYLWWRRVERIRERYSEEEIVSELATTAKRIEEYRERFDAETPASVSLVDADRDATVEETWNAVSDWQTLERRAKLLDAARRNGSASGGTVGRMDA